MLAFHPDLHKCMHQGCSSVRCACMNSLLHIYRLAGEFNATGLVVCASWLSRNGQMKKKRAFACLVAIVIVLTITFYFLARKTLDCWTLVRRKRGHPRSSPDPSRHLSQHLHSHHLPIFLLLVLSPFFWQPSLSAPPLPFARLPAPRWLLPYGHVQSSRDRHPFHHLPDLNRTHSLALAALKVCSV